MKNIFAFVLAALFATSASATAVFAWPSVGDKATYDGTEISANGQSSVPVDVQLQTTAIDTSQDQLTLVSTVMYLGQSNAQTQTTKLSDLQHAAQELPGLVANCGSQGGVPESITTAAGTFNACKQPFSDDTQSGFFWYADVVYGWVKQVNTSKSDGSVLTLTLSSFSNGR